MTGELSKVANPPKEPDRGPAWFQKMFERAGHHDDWGVTCVYDYAAWRLCKAAIRRQRVKQGEKK